MFVIFLEVDQQTKETQCRTKTKNSTDTTKNNQTLDIIPEESIEWKWIVTSIGVLAITSIPVFIICFRLIIRGRVSQKAYQMTEKTQSRTTKTERGIEFSLLLKACQEGNEKSVQQLLDDGADTDAFDKDGCSPLFLACQNGHDSIVQLLLKEGAAINACNKDGTCPLLIACKNGHEETVKLLLDNGTNYKSSRKEDRKNYVSTSNENGQLRNNIADINLCRKTGASPLLRRT